MAEQPTADAQDRSSSTGAGGDASARRRAANRFDIRRVIGFLFALYGVVLIVVGLVGSSQVKHKADNINIDLWTGIGLIVFAALMLAWAFGRPTPAPEPASAGGSRSPEDGGQPERSG